MATALSGHAPMDPHAHADPLARPEGTPPRVGMAPDMSAGPLEFSRSAFSTRFVGNFGVLAKRCRLFRPRIAQLGRQSRVSLCAAERFFR
jgi:hypothetical protein